MPEALATVVSELEDLRPRHDALGELADLEAGVAVATITPGPQQVRWLVRDIAAALRKNDEAAGGVRNPAEGLSLLMAWGVAEPVRHLVVRRADLLMPASWTTLAELCSVWNAHLWLSLQGAALNQARNRWCREWAARRTDWDGFQALWSEEVGERSSSSTSAASAPVLAGLPRLLPTDHFTIWRHRCREVLEPDAFARVDKRFRAELAEARTWLAGWDRDPAAIFERLLTTAREHDHMGELLCRQRAFEVALLHAGALLRDNYNSVLTEALNGGERWHELTEELADRLRMYLKPRWSAAVVIHLTAQCSMEQIAGVDVGDVADDGSTLRVASESYPVGPNGAVLLRAARVWRLAGGASLDDPLLTQEEAAKNQGGGEVRCTSQTVQSLLRTASLELGEALIGPFNRHEGETPTAWATSRRIVLIDLEGAVSDDA